MKLSVIMPVYNREDHVGPALRSLLRQRDAADLDIIVVDDGSTDGSAAVIRSLIEEAPCIRLVQQTNGGVTKARNAGLLQLPRHADFVSFLDSDDISPAGRFRADLACFAGDPGLDLTYSRMMLVDGIDDDTLQPAADSHCMTVRGIHLSAGIFSRKLIERIGAFDEAFKQAEDTDFLLRVFESGPKFVMPDTVALYYRRHPGNMTKQADTALREFMRAIHKSMKRRKADPSLHRVEGIFDFKELADWRFM
ncbi:glycosyltransferase [Mesorhizobium sp. M0152]|uniref:glycosyltransferase family 2 protein n=1 Tax=Mesorhizobium sp. M0152 TaxID=2956898 RepID=UPI00333D13AF